MYTMTCCMCNNEWNDAQLLSSVQSYEQMLTLHASQEKLWFTVGCSSTEVENSFLEFTKK